MSLRDLLQHRPEWIVRKRINSHRAYQGLYRRHFAAVSHRWELKDEPDPTGAQTREVRDMLCQANNADIKYVWLDWWCLYQGERSDIEHEEFKTMLQHVNLLYIGMTVFILLELQYIGRFWTQFEAWLSLQQPGAAGLVPASPEGRRCQMHCIHGAGPELEHLLIEMWAEGTPQEAYQRLAGADVLVTNQSDKDMQLPKILHLHEHVQQILRHVTWLELENCGADTDELIIHPGGSGVFRTAEKDEVNVIAVCGKLRTGKSFLTNALVGREVFGVSPQARSFTQGACVASQLYTCQRFCASGPQIAFVDMEGQANKGLKYDVKLATPILLIAKVVVLNVVCPTGPSHEEILGILKVMVNAARHVKIGEERCHLFGNLHVVLRDCINDEAECHRIIFAYEREGDDEMGDSASAVAKRNSVRTELEQAFESKPYVWCLPRLPITGVPTLEHLDSHGGVAYMAKIAEMRGAMGGQLASPKHLAGTPLTGERIVKLMEHLVPLLDSDAPALSPPDMIEAVDRAIMAEAAAEAERKKRRELEHSKAIHGWTSIVLSIRQKVLRDLAKAYSSELKERTRNWCVAAWKRFTLSMTRQENKKKLVKANSAELKDGQATLLANITRVRNAMD